MKRSALFLLFAVACAALSCSDPVHDGEVAALGPEPGGAPGPTHRPGQPCLVCHGGSGPASTVFATGGTVYEAQNGTPTPLSGGTISLVDANGASSTATSNEAGNFYIPLATYSPTFPVHVSLTFGTFTSAMSTHIGRDASCASCHYDPPNNRTPGHVYLVVDPSTFPQQGAGP